MSTATLTLPSLLLIVLAGCSPNSDDAGNPGTAGAVESPSATGIRDARPDKFAVESLGIDDIHIQSLLDAYRAERPNAARGSLYRTTSSAAHGDVFVVNGFASGWDLAENDELRPSFDAALADNIPENLRDPDSRWFALAYDAQLVVYDKSRVPNEDIARITGYDSLRNGEWRERLCLSSSSLPRNRALVAFLIRKHKSRDAELIVRGWLDNLAEPVFVDDDALLAALADGRCELAILGESQLVSATQSGPGAGDRTQLGSHRFSDSDRQHHDGVIAAVGRHAAMPAAAAEWLSWMIEAAPNGLLAGTLSMVPANTSAPVSSTVDATDSIRASVALPLYELAFLLEDADQLTARAAYP